MNYTKFGHVASMTQAEAKRVVKRMLRQNQDFDAGIEYFDRFDQIELVALNTLIKTGYKGGFYQTEDD